jgi:hypothetical protein
LVYQNILPALYIFSNSDIKYRIMKFQQRTMPRKIH